jgi:hypothetical protein
MKMLTEYLENAVQFEQMAADEKDPKYKETRSISASRPSK